jgi:uncharacterized membrane protein
MAHRTRIASIDIVRGAVMVLMAIDHVRVYSGIPAGGPSPGIFFTRWVTHFCAPAFVFFAGTSAYLYGRNIGDKSHPFDTAQGRPFDRAQGTLARFLVTRGLLLVLLELTLIRWLWTFRIDYSEFMLAGVIWMLGWCMVLMAGLVWLPTRAIAVVGLVTIFAQNLVGLVAGGMPESTSWFWKFLYLGDDVKLGQDGPTISVLYSIVPWIGVMAAGYAFGAIMTREPAERDRLCLRIGVTATALFLALGGLGVFLQQAPANAPPAFIRLLNQQKYPASQLFLMMTLGPTIAVLPLAERARGWMARVLAVFGRVPMFYYLLHIPVIHVAALVVTFLREGSLHPERYAYAPYTSVPEEFRWSLPLLYLVFFIVVVVLYFPCRSFAELKARRQDAWLRYI